MTSEEMYTRWLLECVLIRCWTTLKCAKEIGADPRQVKYDLDMAINALPRIRREFGK